MYHSIFSRCFWSALILICTGGSLVAQSGSDSDGVTFRMLTFDRVKDLRVIYLHAGKKVEEVKMHKNNFTGPFRAKSRTIRFVHSIVAEGEKPVSAGSVKIPSAMGNKVILVAVPASESKYHFFPIADNFSRFQAGGMKLINLSRVPILAKLNSKDYALKPMGVSSIEKVSTKNKPHSYPVEFYYRAKNKWNPFSSSYWYHEPDVRHLAFCYPDQKTKRIRIRTIRELPPAKQQQ